MEHLIQRVGIPMFIQIAIESWNELILLMLISIMLVGKTLDKSKNLPPVPKIPLTGELIVFYLAAFVYNLVDIIAGVSLDTTQSFSFAAARISVFLYFAVGCFQTWLFLQVIKKYIAEKLQAYKLKNAIVFVQVFQLVNVLLLIANLFTEILYTIDSSNHYQREWGILIWQGITIASFVFIGVVLVIYWKKIDDFLKKIIIGAAVFPLFAFFGSFYVLEVSLNSIAVIFSAMLTFMFYEKNKTHITVRRTYELETARMELMEKQLVIEQHKQELQENKIKLLVAQIQPHFIFNSLMALQSKCTDNPELYEGIKSFAKYLRASFEAMTDNTMISFAEELKCIRSYIQLERMNYGDKLRVEYDIEVDHFMLPALCVEPLVENAIRYGVGTYEQGGLVKISVLDEPDCILIQVWDDGSGGNKLTDAQKGRKSIGLENVRLRLRAMDMGELSVTQNQNGTSAVIRLKYKEEQSENHHH